MNSIEESTRHHNRLALAGWLYSEEVFVDEWMDGKAILYVTEEMILSARSEIGEAVNLLPGWHIIRLNGADVTSWDFYGARPDAQAKAWEKYVQAEGRELLAVSTKLQPGASGAKCAMVEIGDATIYIYEKLGGAIEPTGEVIVEVDDAGLLEGLRVYVDEECVHEAKWA